MKTGEDEDAEHQEEQVLETPTALGPWIGAREELHGAPGNDLLSALGQQVHDDGHGCDRESEEEEAAEKRHERTN